MGQKFSPLKAGPKIINSYKNIYDNLIVQNIYYSARINTFTSTDNNSLRQNNA